MLSFERMLHRVESERQNANHGCRRLHQAGQGAHGIGNININLPCQKEYSDRLDFNVLGKDAGHRPDGEGL